MQKVTFEAIELNRSVVRPSTEQNLALSSQKWILFRAKTHFNLSIAKNFIRCARVDFTILFIEPAKRTSNTNATLKLGEHLIFAIKHAFSICLLLTAFKKVCVSHGFVLN